MRIILAILLSAGPLFAGETASQSGDIPVEERGPIAATPIVSIGAMFRLLVLDMCAQATALASFKWTMAWRRPISSKWSISRTPRFRAGRT